MKLLVESIKEYSILKDKFRIFGNDRFDYQSSFPIDDSNLKEQKSNIQIAEKQFFYQGKPILEN